MNTFIEISAGATSLSRRSLVFGVGVNDAKYIIRPKISGKYVRCPYYVVWADMLKRCYSEYCILKQPTYINCIVCDDWLIFSNFRKWMEKQDWKGNQLDKDLLVLGNKVYSPSTCVFISQKINNFIRVKRKDNTELPVGVYYSKKDKKYKAEYSYNGRGISLGGYATIGEAELAYKIAQKAKIQEAAMAQDDKIIEYALYRVADRV